MTKNFDGIWNGHWKFNNSLWIILNSQKKKDGQLKKKKKSKKDLKLKKKENEDPNKALLGESKKVGK